MGETLAAGRLRLPGGADRRVLAAAAAVLVAYVVLRVVGFAGVTTLDYRDSESYLEVAGRSLLSLDFWAGSRSWTVPLLYKLLPDDNQARAIGQLVLSIVCWAALAVVVARSVRPSAYGVVALALVLTFSLSFAVIRWDRLILTESVSISLTVAVAAAWLELLRAPRRGAALAVLGVSLLWVFTRDSNGLLCLLSAGPAAVWLARPGSGGRRWPAVLTLGLVAIFGINVASTTTDTAQLRRNERPMLHVIGRRVLVNPAQQAFFERRGMPRPPPRVVLYRKKLAAINDTIASDPETDRFLGWVREHARVTLARWLIAHPRATLRPIWKFRKRLLRGVTEGYRAPDAKQMLFEPLASLVYPHQVAAVLRWLALVLAAAALVATFVGAARAWLVAIGLIALQLPHALLVYHGDTLEIPRHAILVAVSLRLGALLLAVLVLGKAIEWAVARRRGWTDVRLPQERP